VLNSTHWFKYGTWYGLSESLEHEHLLAMRNPVIKPTTSAQTTEVATAIESSSAE